MRFRCRIGWHNWGDWTFWREINVYFTWDEKPDMGGPPDHRKLIYERVCLDCHMTDHYTRKT